MACDEAKAGRDVMMEGWLRLDVLGAVSTAGAAGSFDLDMRLRSVINAQPIACGMATSQKQGLTCNAVFAGLQSSSVGIQQVTIAVKHEVVQRAAVMHGQHPHVFHICARLNNVQDNVLHNIGCCLNSNGLQKHIKHLLKLATASTASCILQ